jgi:hypothetical protein
MTYQKLLEFLIGVMAHSFLVATVTEAIIEGYRRAMVEQPLDGEEPKIQGWLERKSRFVWMIQRCGFCSPYWVSLALSAAMVIGGLSPVPVALYGFPVAARLSHCLHDLYGWVTVKRNSASF